MKTLLEQMTYDRLDELSEEQFRSRYKLDKLFLDVPRFCEITGFPRSTIYQYIREDRFFLPCALVSKTPYIKTADFVNWYLAGCTTSRKGNLVGHVALS